MKNPKFGFEMKTYWDTFEGSYQMGPQKHRVFLLDLLANNGVESLLDVGCGTGPIYELVNNRTDNKIIYYKGTDYSPAMIAVAKENFPDADFEVQDARELKEKDRSWDAVLLMHCLDHLDDYQSAIREAARVAKKYVCIVLWRSFVNGRLNNLNNKNMFGKKEGEEPWKDTYLQDYSRELLEEEFKKNNLEVKVATGGEEINDPNRYNFLFLLEKK